MDLNGILHEAIVRGASDVHLKVGMPPTVRIHGILYPLEDASPFLREDMASILDVLLDEHHRERFRSRMQVDLAYQTTEATRFRVNVFLQRGEPSVAMRAIPARIRTVEELHLPPIVNKLALENRGLILVTGTTGSGKSTTLAAMVGHINENCSNHIITIEDPIEYTHEDVRSIVSQRELGYDVTTFADGLKAALRQDPDVILVGEMRDLETIETAILAAETGHLVLSTLHTLDATETVTRIVSNFPEHQREQIRLILANIIRGILSQRLMPRADGQGMVPACEVMVSTARIRDCIAIKEKTPEIRDAIAVGHSGYGMQTFDQSLMALYRRGLITYEEALAQSSNPDDFALKVRGVASTSDRRWEDFERAPQDDAGEAERLKIDRF
ncbi:MAG TPA: type IV pilus twitching motility protein PilT [Candidatus Binatia bacterium]|nr:type IV pilus twitching motility protein PilT [Candidatus Binatia bacterium]